MTNKIIEAAREAGFVVQRDEWVLQTMLRTFYAIAYRAGLEAAKAVAITTASPYGDKYGEGYNRSALDVEKRIDALMKEDTHG